MYTTAYELWELIEALRERFIHEDDFFKRRKLYKRLKKYQKMYDVIVSDETHKEIINNMEMTTRGY